MEHTLEILVELEVDGVSLAGFPFRSISAVDYCTPFVTQDFGDAGFNVPVVQPANQLQALFITSDQDFAIRLNGEPSVTIAPLCSGFVLLVGAAIDVPLFLTAKATDVVPASLWGFVAGKQT